MSRLTEIEERWADWLWADDDSLSELQFLRAHAPADIEYLLGEVRRLRELLREANYDATDSDGMFPRNPLL